MKNSAMPPNHASCASRALFSAGIFFSHDCEADEGRNCKCRGQQAHDIIRPGRRDEAMDEKKLRHAGQCRRRPWNHRVTEFF